MDTTSLDSNPAVAVPNAEVPPAQPFTTFAEFYAYYLTEHSNRNCRRFHFIGTTSALLFAGVAIATVNPAWAAVSVVTAYGLAWAGHFLFEKNKPLAWQYFFWSFASDWVMYGQMLRGKVSF